MAVALCAGLFAGGTPLAPADVANALAHPHAGGDVGTIVWVLRAPRVVLAALVGAALAIAGFLLQGMLRNPPITGRVVILEENQFRILVNLLEQITRALRSLSEEVAHVGANHDALLKALSEDKE